MWERMIVLQCWSTHWGLSLLAKSLLLNVYCNLLIDGHFIQYCVTRKEETERQEENLVRVQNPTHLGLHFNFYNLVLVHAIFDETLHFAVELHENHVGGVARQQRGTFPHGDKIIQEEDDKHYQIQDIEGDITEERPPRQVEDLLGEDGAHPDHEENVEDSRADDGPNAHVAVRDEDANDGGEEFRGWTASRHEGGTCYVVWNGQFLGDDSESWDKELITHYG